MGSENCYFSNKSQIAFLPHSLVWQHIPYNRSQIQDTHLQADPNEKQGVDGLPGEQWAEMKGYIRFSISTCRAFHGFGQVKLGYSGFD